MSVDHEEIRPFTEDEIRSYGYEPWDRTKKGPPDDWNREKVLYEGGFVGSLNTEDSYHWNPQEAEDSDLNIIGYPTDESMRNGTMDIANRRK